MILVWCGVAHWVDRWCRCRCANYPTLSIPEINRICVTESLSESEVPFRPKFNGLRSSIHQQQYRVWLILLAEPLQVTAQDTEGHHVLRVVEYRFVSSIWLCVCAISRRFMFIGIVILYHGLHWMHGLEYYVLWRQLRISGVANSMNLTFRGKETYLRLKLALDSNFWPQLLQEQNADNRASFPNLQPRVRENELHSISPHLTFEVGWLLPHASPVSNNLVESQQQCRNICRSNKIYTSTSAADAARPLFLWINNDTAIINRSVTLILWFRRSVVAFI